MKPPANPRLRDQFEHQYAEAMKYADIFEQADFVEVVQKEQ